MKQYQDTPTNCQLRSLSLNTTTSEALVQPLGDPGDALVPGVRVYRRRRARLRGALGRGELLSDVAMGQNSITRIWTAVLVLASIYQGSIFGPCHHDISKLRVKFQDLGLK